MKTGRPRASKTMPGKVSAKMPPMPMPGAAGPMGAPGGFSKGGRINSKNNSKNPMIQPAGTRKKPTIESKSKVNKTNKMGFSKGGKVKK